MVNDLDPSDENYNMPTYEEVFNQRKEPIRRKMTEGQKRSGRKIRFNNVIPRTHEHRWYKYVL